MAGTGFLATGDPVPGDTPADDAGSCTSKRGDQIMKRRGRLVAVSLVLVALVLGAVTQVSSAPNEKVRVWVGYAPGKAAQVNGLLRQAGAEHHYHFAELDAFVITLPSVALEGIAHNPNVTLIEEDPVRYLDANASRNARLAARSNPKDKKQTVPWGIDAVQARDVWDADRDGEADEGAPTGAGITVCIIDTGLYTEHEDFEGVPILGGLSFVDDNWARDVVGHGTHVGGIVAAANNKVGVVGVSPGQVSLLMMKVDDDGEGIWSSDLVAAVYECGVNGAKVINMSLGGLGQYGWEKKAFKDMYSRGILLIAGAGNEGIETDFYPASNDTVISVAGVDENMVVADFSTSGDHVELAAPAVNVLSTEPYIKIAELTVDKTPYSGILIENALYGEASGVLVDGGLCDTTGDWGGMVVLCERGEVYFSDKVRNVEDSGGVATVIYNNEPGDLHALLLPGHYANILALGITQEAGQFLVTNELGSTADVFTSYQWPVSGYGTYIDGTSWSTAYVSGVAALIWSANPGWTNVQIREAMNQTALDLGDPGRDIHYGYGLVQAYDALQYLYQAGE
jgi:serine protease